MKIMACNKSRWKAANQPTKRLTDIKKKKKNKKKKKKKKKKCHTGLFFCRGIARLTNGGITATWRMINAVDPAYSVLRRPL
jgi:hypothetical protein